MPQHDEARRFFAALADTEQRAHLQVAEIALVEDIYSQTGTGGHFAGAFSNHSRRLSIRRLVDKAARPVDRFSDDGTLVDRLPVGTGKDDFLDARPGIRSLVDLHRKAANQDAFHDSAYVTTGECESPYHSRGHPPPRFEIGSFRNSNENNPGCSGNDNRLEWLQWQIATRKQGICDS